MAIRFRCVCGALFEVSEENAGRQGRCRRCGSEMAIPEVSDDQAPDAKEGFPRSTPRGPDAAESQASPLPPRFDLTTRFCPFCGKDTGADPEICPSCFRQIKPKKVQRYGTIILSPVEWVFVTVLAPFGFLSGFVNLILGNRKGLHMMGISTLSMLMMWIVLMVMNWLAQ